MSRSLLSLSRRTPRLPSLTHPSQTHSRLLSTTSPLANANSNADSTASPKTNTSTTDQRAQDSLPGWPGRHGRDHAVKRPPHDVQAEQSQQGIKDHESLKEGSDAISRRDEKSSNKRAKEEHPEAPEPVIGMNDERGSVSINTTSLKRQGADQVTERALKLSRRWRGRGIHVRKYGLVGCIVHTGAC